jgi:glycosyltransferase involved in cell wall biosynthesis
VILTVYNYAALVGAAIASVGSSDFEDFELIVIDDASTDGSREAIREAIAGVPWVRARIVTRAENQGLARARNLGAELADGELLFILDADNTIYPHALGTLVGALDARPDCAFAYGIIEQFDIDGPRGLTSFLGWDAVRLRYGNFVDAMAMIRRTAMLAAGGYSLDPRLHGWEDFALWCAIADRGESGLRVPEVLSRYRVALHSMISLTNIDASSAWSVLLDRFRCLSTPPELEDQALQST